MKTDKPNLKQLQLRFETNPFLEQMDDGEKFTIKTTLKSKVMGKNAKDVIMDKTSGEITGGMLFYNTQKVDSEKFIKIYSSHISHLYDLSKTGNRAFGFVANELKPNTDKVYISYKDMMLYCGWTSLQMCYKGVKELISNDIICPHINSGWFFINPKVLFNGNRIAIFQDYQRWDNSDLDKPEMLH